jgi:hypothetical protein
MKLEFSQHNFRKIAQISNFMKTRPVGAELFHADERTDMTKLRVAFRNLGKAPKNALCGQNAKFFSVKAGCT